ncbi:MAG: PqqD family peptide modification chaperone [Bacteroidales bacterium]|nr:PqqD family peptide modification chaperone [Bacteroidales bacterium]
MLVRQTKNTFIRFIDEMGYITNQMTRHDRTYNETGADFLKEINRQPQNVDDIVARLRKVYNDSVSTEELRADFVEFIQDLADHLFLVVGETPEELDVKDLDFSYSMENPKTLVDDFTQDTKQVVNECTQDFMLEATQRKPRLNGLQFELTSRCNERCIHCYIPNPKKNNGGDMPIEKVKSLIDEFAEMGGLHVTLSGGEVFLHKDIIPIIKYCREKDMQISILSNLIALKDEQIPFIKEANVSLVQTSLYSMDPAIHDLITTVKGSQVKTKEAIEKLVAADIPVQISCPIMKANCKGYADVLQYAQSLRCKAQTDYIMMAQSDLDTSNLANRISLEETETVLRDIMKWDKDYKENTLTQPPIVENFNFDVERFAKQPLCGAGINDCCITENGDVYPCAGWQAMVCGNVYKQSLKEIWENSPQFKQVRAVTQGDFPECLKCEARNFCAMCLVRNYNESGGDMFKINKHFCNVAFLNKKVVEEYAASNAEDYAMRYERLICDIYHCERFVNVAADADIYRRLVNEYFRLVQVQNTHHRDGEQECKISYGKTLEEINFHLMNAIDNIKCAKQENYEKLKTIKHNFPLRNIPAVNYAIDSMRQILRDDKQ